jgi:hypothetical protein
LEKKPVRIGEDGFRKAHCNFHTQRVKKSAKTLHIPISTGTKKRRDTTYWRQKISADKGTKLRFGIKKIISLSYGDINRIRKFHALWKCRSDLLVAYNKHL